ncbi:MAG: hypothetical protein ACOCWM_00495, partial [Cyclobacteriaceae bacterium]
MKIAYNRILNIIFVIVLILVFSDIYCQDISISVNIPPPYSNNVHDYLGGDEGQQTLQGVNIFISIRNNNLGEAKEVQLLAAINGDNGITARINPAYRSVRSLILQPGEQIIVNKDDLNQLFSNLEETDIQYTGISQQEIIRTNTLPEGNYQVCFTALDYFSGQVVSATTPLGCSAPIAIFYPDPPVIAYPFHESEIIATDPQALNISWAPSPNLRSLVNYKVRIIELNDLNANMYDLFERSSVSFFEERDLLATNLFYDQTRPAFQVGKTYAIRIQAYDPFGQLQIKNNGWSEIHTFTYLENPANNAIADVDQIVLLPDYLKLINLENLEVAGAGNNKIYNGIADLAITSPVYPAVDRLISVQVNNLEVRTISNDVTQISGGNITGRLNQLPRILDELENEYLNLEQISWNNNEGLHLTAEVDLPDGRKVTTKGKVELTPYGVFGSLASDNSEQKLAEIGQSPVRLAVTGVKVFFPDGNREINGKLLLFDNKHLIEGCEIAGIKLDEDTLGTDITCQIENEIELFQNKANLRTNYIAGKVRYDRLSDQLTYDINMYAGLKINPGKDNLCQQNLTLHLISGQPLSAEILENSCTSTTIDAGFVQLAVSDISLQEFKYNTNNEFSFDITANAHFIFPLFDDYRTPLIENISITDQRLLIPFQQWEEEQLYAVQDMNWSDMIVDIYRMTSNKIEYRWFNEPDANKTPWNFTMSAKARFANAAFPGNCFRNTTFDVMAAYDIENNFAGIIDFENFNCSWPLGNFSYFNLENLEGKLIGARLDQQFVKSYEIKLNGSLHMDGPLACQNQDFVELANSEIYLRDGKIEGTMDNLMTACTAEIGPLTAEITNAALQFYYTGDSSSVFVNANAKLQAQKNDVFGSFIYDVVNNKFTKVDFNINKPFTWNIPEEEPVFSFTINRARLNENGFYIDGRNDLNLKDGKKIKATFDQLLLNLEEKRIVSGKVIFDSNFSLHGNDLTDKKFRFQAVSNDFQLNQDGLLLQLPGTLQLDKDGIGLEGVATASLKHPQLNLENLRAEFHNEFAFGLYPFRVNSGTADFYHQENHVAYLDATGFYPQGIMGADIVLPDRLPLPSDDVAYIQLKDGNGQLLVDVTRENDIVYISTKPNRPLDLVMPALQHINGQIPSVEVNFNRFGIHSGSHVPQSGSIEAVIDENTTSFDVASGDFIIKPRRIVYGVANNGMNDYQALIYQASIFMYGQEVVSNGEAILGIQSDGVLAGYINIDQLSTSISLADNSDKVQLQLKQIQGSIQLPLEDMAGADYDLNIAAQISLHNHDDATMAFVNANLNFKPAGMTVNNINADGNPEGPAIIYDKSAITFSNLRDVRLGYQDNAWNFNLVVDATITLQNTNNDSFNYKVEGISVNNNGISFPALEFNDNSPGYNMPVLTYNIMQLKPLAVYIPETTFNWYIWKEGDPLTWLPEVDLELTIDDQEFQRHSLTINRAKYNPDGTFSGEIIDYTVDINGLMITVTDDLQIDVEKLHGNITFEENSQKFNLYLDGKLHYPETYAQLPQNCVEPTISLGMDQGGNFIGSVEDFDPCATIVYGPLTLKFTGSKLTFTHINNEQQATLEGGAIAAIKRENNTDVTATGDLKLDLVDGQVLDGELLVNGPFQWHYPLPDTLLTLVVDNAKIDNKGLTFNGNGNVKVDSGNVGISYGDITFSLPDFQLVDGEATINNQLVWHIGFTPNTMKFDLPGQGPDYQFGLSINVPALMKLNSTGLLIADAESTAKVNIADSSYEAVVARYVDNFTYGPRQNGWGVTRGHIDFYIKNPLDATQEVHFAKYDANGFSFTSLGAGSLASGLVPDTLFLPDRETAYIVLRDPGTSQLLVEVSDNEDGGKNISTTNGNTLQIVLVSLANGGDPLKYNITLNDVVINKINEQWQLVSGTIIADLSNNPLNLSELPLKAPLIIEQLAYQKRNDETALYAKAKLLLPEFLNNVNVEIPYIKINKTGIASAQYIVGVLEGTNPVYSQTFNNGAFGLEIMGVEIKYNYPEISPNNEYKMVGRISSNVFENDERIAFEANYLSSDEDDNVRWQFNAQSNVGQIITFPGGAGCTISNPSFEVTDERIAFGFDGMFSFTGLGGNNSRLEITVNGINISSDNGLSVTEVSMNNPQKLTLFNQQDILEVNELALSAENNVIYLTLSGKLNLFDLEEERKLRFRELKLGTDGSLSLASASQGLLAQDQEIKILNQYLVLKQVEFLIQDNQPGLRITGSSKLPDPFTNSGNFSLDIDKNGGLDGNINLSIQEEKDLGGSDFIRLTLTNAGVDFNPFHLDQTKFYASAKLAIKNNSDNSDRIIYIGQQGRQGFEQAGIKYRYEGSLQWHIEAVENFQFDTEFFNYDVTATAEATSESLALSLSGRLGLRLDAVSTINFENYRIDADGFHEGDITGGSLSINNIFSVTVGAITYFNTNTPTTIYEINAEGKDSTAIEVNTYFKMDASTLSVANVFEGGFDEILYYKSIDAVKFKIVNVRVQAQDQFRFLASFEYYKNNDDFLIRVLGSAYIQDKGGSLYGKLARINNKNSIGLFVKIDTDIPIIPGIIGLYGVGGGFFYNPDNKDLDDVVNSLGKDEKPARIPWEDPDYNFNNNKFALAIYAGSYMIGGGKETSVMTGSLFMMLTNTFILYSYKYEMKLSFAGSTFIYINWGDPNNTIINAIAKMEPVAPLSAIIDGELQAEFKYLSNNGNALWMFQVGTITGAVSKSDNNSLKLFKIINVDINLLVNNDGFIFKLAAGVDVAVVAASIKAELWYTNIKNEFGAYGELIAKIDFWLAGAEGTLKGALIMSNGKHIIGCSGELKGWLLGMEKSISASVIIKDGDVSAHRGSKFDELIARAKAERDNIAANAADFENKMNEAFLKVRELSDAELALAGQNLFFKDYYYRLGWAARYRSNECYQTSPRLVPESANIIADVVQNFQLTDENKKREIDQLYNQYTEAKEELASIEDAINSFAQFNLQVLEMEEDVQRQISKLESPAEICFNTVDSSYNFSIKEEINAANQQTTENVQQMLQNQYNRVNEVIANVLDNIQKVEGKMLGFSLTLSTSNNEYTESNSATKYA